MDKVYLRQWRAMHEPWRQYLCEINQTQKDKFLYDSMYMKHLVVSKSTQKESRIVLTWGLEEGDMESLLIVTEFHFGIMKKFCNWMLVVVADNVNVLNVVELHA